jgi:hypothetical protein
MSGDRGLAKQAITKRQQDPYGERRHGNGKNDIDRLTTATGVTRPLSYTTDRKSVG